LWSSASAVDPNTGNYGGISDPGVDALVDKVVSAKDRETLIAATKALDRVLLANHFLVPSFTMRQARVACWNRFSHPDTLPAYSIGFPSIWWYDKDKAAKTGGAI
jgi:microcin C transport system substrate-binding protein